MVYVKKFQEGWTTRTWFRKRMHHFHLFALFLFTIFVALTQLTSFFSGLFNHEGFVHHQQEQPDQAEQSIMLAASHDLDIFIPFNNESTSFALDGFQYFLLSDKVAGGSTSSESLLNNPKYSWMVPEKSDAMNSSMLHSYTTAASAEKNKTGDGNDYICQIICRFGENNYGYFHFPHFLQHALPCYNMFHFFSKTIQIDPLYPLRNYMVLPNNIKSLNDFSAYTQDFLKAMQGHPYYVRMIYGFDEIIPVHEDCIDASVFDRQGSGNKKVLESSTSNAILVSKIFDESGWDHAVRYFLSSDPMEAASQYSYDSYDFIQHLQQSVLGDQYNAGLSEFKYDDRYSKMTKLTLKQKQRWRLRKQMLYRILQVLILDRKGTTRTFANIDIVISALNNYAINCSTTTTMTQFRLNVRYVPSFNRLALREQAYIMHHSDIIYSPHGAQLSNLMFIRPCTAVVEFFPRTLYLQFFQAMVVSVRGLSFEGYPSAATTNFTDKVTDTLLTINSSELQILAKSKDVNATPSFFIMTLPQIMHESILCRKYY